MSINSLIASFCDNDMEDIEYHTPANTLWTKMDDFDVRNSLNMPISVVYNLIDVETTKYHFRQHFENDEANLYFERMREFASSTINDLIDSEERRRLHLYESKRSGTLNKVLSKLKGYTGSQDVPPIYHFALDPKNSKEANREKNTRNPRIYFMVGYNGQIHILFFDPYHEINP